MRHADTSESSITEINLDLEELVIANSQHMQVQILRLDMY